MKEWFRSALNEDGYFKLQDPKTGAFLTLTKRHGLKLVKNQMDEKVPKSDLREIKEENEE